MRAYFQFIIRHRIAVLIICLFVTVLSLASISRAVIATSIGKLFLGESPAYVEYISKTETFGNDELLIIGLNSSDLLGPGRQERIRAAVERIKEIPIVARVESMLSAQHLRLENETLVVSRYGDEAASQPDRIPSLIATMAKDPLVEGLVISSNGEQAAIIVELKPDPARPVEEGPRLEIGRAHV